MSRVLYRKLKLEEIIKEGDVWSKMDLENLEMQNKVEFKTFIEEDKGLNEMFFAINAVGIAYGATRRHDCWSVFRPIGLVDPEPTEPADSEERKIDLSL